MQKLRDFTETLEDNFEKILAVFKSFWATESHDYEKYLVARKNFKDMVKFILKWEITPRRGSQASKLYQECDEEMLKIEDFASGKCTEQGSKDDICLHFISGDYYQAVKEFIEKAEAKLNSLSAEILDQDFEDLETMEERSRALIEISRTYGGNFKITVDALSRTGQSLLDAMKSAC